MSATRRDFLKAFGLTAAALAADPASLAGLIPSAEAPAVALAGSGGSVASFIIRALPSNKSNIYFAPTPEMAKDKVKAMVLTPGSWIEFDGFGAPTVFFGGLDLENQVEVSTFMAGGDGGGGGGIYARVK